MIKTLQGLSIVFGVSETKLNAFQIFLNKSKQQKKYTYINKREAYVMYDSNELYSTQISAVVTQQVESESQRNVLFEQVCDLSWK